MACFVYILRSAAGERYYVGSSGDPERRLRFHNSKEKGFTSRYRPWELVFKQEYGSVKQARAVEQKIKRWKSRMMIEKLLAGSISV